MTGTLAWRATGATAVTDLANSGPRISVAPSLIALLGCGPGAFRRALVVLDHQLQVGIVALEQRQLGGLLEALADQPGVALRRQRHEQRDLDRCLGFGGFLRLTAISGIRNAGSLPLEHAPSKANATAPTACRQRRLAFAAIIGPPRKLAPAVLP